MLCNKSRILTVGRWDITFQELITAYEERVLDPTNRLKITILKDMLYECMEGFRHETKWGYISFGIYGLRVENRTVRDVFTPSHDGNKSALCFRELRIGLFKIRKPNSVRSRAPLDVYRFDLLRTWFAFHLVLCYIVKKRYVSQELL